MSEPTSTSLPSARQAVLLVAFMWFAYFLNYCDRQAVFSMFPVLKSDLGFTDKQLGFVGASFLWIYGVGSFFAGQIGDKFSKRRLIIWSLSLWSLVTIATGLANSPNMVLTLRALMGISEALFMPAAIALTANAFPPATRSRAIAALTTAQILGNVGGGWFGGWMAQQGQWRMAFFVLGAVGLVFALPYFAFLRGVSEEAQVETKRQEPSEVQGARSEKWDSLASLVVLFVTGFGVWLLFSQSPGVVLTFLIGALAAGATVGMAFEYWRSLCGRFRRVWLFAASLLGSAPFLFILCQVDLRADPLWFVGGFGLCIGSFIGTIVGPVVLRPRIVTLTKVPTYWLLCVVFPVFVFGLWLLYGWLPNFLHEKFALNLSDSAFNATVFLQGATLVGMLSGGVLADVLYRRTKAARLWLLTASLLGCAPFLHYLGNSDTLAATRVAAMGFGLFSGFFMGNIFPSAFEIVPADARASAVGVLNLFGAVISGFATLAGGALKQSVGINNLLTYTALAYVLAGLAVIAGIRLFFPRDYERVH